MTRATNKTTEQAGFVQPLAADDPRLPQFDRQPVDTYFDSIIGDDRETAVAKLDRLTAEAGASVGRTATFAEQMDENLRAIEAIIATHDERQARKAGGTTFRVLTGGAL